jgi:hypothetical protein
LKLHCRLDGLLIFDAAAAAAAAAVTHDTLLSLLLLLLLLQLVLLLLLLMQLTMLKDTSRSAMVSLSANVIVAQPPLVVA